MAALKVAIRNRSPPRSASIVPTLDRDTEAYRKLLAARGLTSSMNRCGNPDDNEDRELHGMPEIKAVYLPAGETFETPGSTSGIS